VTPWADQWLVRTSSGACVPCVVGQAQEIANAILWLLSDEASFISGVTLDASGGGFVFGKR